MAAYGCFCAGSACGGNGKAMRALLTLNERSRLGSRDAPVVRSCLETRGISVVQKNESPQAVIAAGGDGTVLSAISAALDLNLPLGIVPLGTFNELARTLEVPNEIDGACAVIARGAARRIDLGRVNGVYFVNEASIGLSARIARRQTAELKQRYGYGAIVATALQSIGDARPFFCEIRYGDSIETARTIQLTVANSGRFGGIVSRNDASIDDGFLDLYSVEARNWLDGVRVVRKVLAHDASSDKTLRVRRARRFFVRTHHQHHVCADGEPAGTTPALFEVLPAALEVFVP